MTTELREPGFHRENTGGSIGAPARRLAPSMKATLKWVWSFLKASFALVLGTYVMVASAGWGSLPLALAMMLLVVVKETCSPPPSYGTASPWHASAVQ